MDNSIIYCMLAENLDAEHAEYLRKAKHYLEKAFEASHVPQKNSHKFANFLVDLLCDFGIRIKTDEKKIYIDRDVTINEALNILKTMKSFGCETVELVNDGSCMCFDISGMGFDV